MKNYKKTETAEKEETKKERKKKYEKSFSINENECVTGPDTLIEKKEEFFSASHSDLVNLLPRKNFGFLSVDVNILDNIKKLVQKHYLINVLFKTKRWWWAPEINVLTML